MSRHGLSFLKKMKNSPLLSKSIPPPSTNLTTHYLSVLGQDRLGFVNDVTDSIQCSHGNIENSTMSVLDHHY